MLANDTDNDGGAISITAVTQPANGAVVITGGGTGLTVQPNADYCNSPPGTTLDTFTYTLTPGGSTATVTVTVTCADDPPVAVNDAAAVNEDSGANALSVLANDTDVDGGPISITAVTQPANGAVVITGGGTGLTYQPNADYCNSPPGTTLDTFTYTLSPGGSTATVTVTVTCVNDAPVIALPGAAVFYDPTTAIPVVLDATATVTDVDSPDFDTGILTADVTTNCENNDRLDVRNQGTGVGQISVSGATVNYNFGSGPIAIGTIATEFDCATPALPSLTVTLNASATPTATRDLLRNVTFFSNSPTPVGTSRNVNVFLTDGDGGTGNTASKAVSIDAPPKVNTITPANNATGVALTDNVVITFSEAVNVSGNWFQIACPTSGNRDALTGVSVSGGPTVHTVNPNADFANGEVCAVTVTAPQVADQDAIDPPDKMAANFTSTFTTVDTAPRVTSATPAEAATVANNQTVTLNFSEGVDIAAGGITWNCGGAVTFTPGLPQNNVATLTLTPTGALTNGASCTVTLESTLITDNDTIDPPNQLDGDSSGDIIENDADDFTRSFTVDVPPTLNGSTPANGDSNVSVSGNIALTFSEAVDVTTSSFTINCGSGNLAYGLSGNGTSAVTLDPSPALPGATSCTVSVSGGNVSDSDGIDSPDTMTSSPSFSFTTQAIAVDDSYTVTPHLTLAVDTGIQSGRVTANDQLGGIGSITGFGFGACSGTAPGAQLDAGVANGRLTLNLNGSFSYEPPAGVANTTRTFCYTVTGGDTANIAFTLQNTELVWFVDAAAASGGVGNQARPFQTLGGAVAVDTAGDAIFVKDNAADYTCGITLSASEKLIGEGSGSTLATLSGGGTPVAGSAFPTLTNTNTNWPGLTAGADCVTLNTDNTIRGFNFGNVGSANTALTGATFGTLTVNDAAIATDGRALNLNTGTLTGTFSGVTSTSGTNNLSLIIVGGTSDFGSGVLSGASGTAVNLLGGNATISYVGTISKSSAGRLVDMNNRTGGSVTLSGNLSSTGTSTGINVSNNTGGTHTFSGTTKTLSTGANAAVTLAANTGATINFSGGGLGITTTSGTGFTATGGATAINVTGSGNTITSTTGTALNVANTSIGAPILNFQSISSDGGTNTGIILDTTGSAGGLTVTGDGTDTSLGGNSTGGTIANKTGSDGSTTTGIGIYLNNTSNVSLRRMNLHDFQNFGIRGFNVNGFILEYSTVNSTASGTSKNGGADVQDEGSIAFGKENPSGINGLVGTVNITNCLIEDGFENNFKIANLGGTLSQFTMTGTTIRDNSTASPGNNGFEFRVDGTADITADITTSTFTGNRANGIQVSTVPSSTGTVDVEVGVAGTAGSGGTFTNNNIGVNIAHGGSGTLNFDVHRGTYNSSPGLASPININLAAGSGGPMSGSITNNVITNANSPTGPGIRVTTNGTDADGSNVLTTQISNNNISQIGNRGIEMIARDGNSDINATVTNNIVQLTDPSSDNGIWMESGAIASDTTTICAAISGNDSDTVAGQNGIRIQSIRAGTTFRLPSYSGAATDPDGEHDLVVAHLASLNPATPVIRARHKVTGGVNSGFTPGGAACPTP